MSSRRKAVQAKRSRLGLNVDGKMSPFIYDDYPSWMLLEGRPLFYRLYKPTRKESMIAALQAERIMTTYPQWIKGDREARRLRIMRNWIRWQMRVRYTRVRGRKKAGAVGYSDKQHL